MYRIEPFQRADLPIVAAFVCAIQEHERIATPELRPGSEIASSYTELLLRTVAEQDGVMLLAKHRDHCIGFACAWIEEDDDPLVREDARHLAYVSDIFVEDGWRRRGVGRMLLAAVEAEMLKRGCRRVRARRPPTSRPRDATKPPVIGLTKSHSTRRSARARRPLPSRANCANPPPAAMSAFTGGRNG